jgi:hypothetical protein
MICFEGSYLKFTIKLIWTELLFFDTVQLPLLTIHLTSGPYSRQAKELLCSQSDIWAIHLTPELGVCLRVSVGVLSSLRFVHGRGAGA